jgi:hypothetical protein
MPRKPTQPRKTNDPEQHKRFLDMAREVEADESPDAMDRAFKRVVHPPPKKSPVKNRRAVERGGRAIGLK